MRRAAAAYYSPGAHPLRQVVKVHPKTRFVLAGEGAMRSGFEKHVRDLGLHENFLFLGRARCSRDPCLLRHRGSAVARRRPAKRCIGIPGRRSARRHHCARRKHRDHSGWGNRPAGSPRDPESLAAASTRLLSDNDLATRIAQAGHDYVNQNFSFERLVAVIDALYAKLLHSLN